MIHRIPEEKIAEIKDTADIVDIISDTVRLKKAGRNFLGLCPFHNEKTPSFSVSPDKQIFHCFGCGVGGNVFTFLIKQEGFSFPEAVRMLADRYGIDLPSPQMSPEQARKHKIREDLQAINTAAAEFFRANLSNSRAGREAARYLLNRGLTRETIDRFGLGYAPDGWDHLIRHFKQKGLPPAKLEESGLVIARQSRTGYYDRFRNRVMFPIFSQNRQVIGFGGRVMDDSLPKYLNSPETMLYNKSRSLYGLHNARTECRRHESVIIVEGYFDLLALHQNGISNSVATLGTALTDSHVKTLRGYIGQNGKAMLVYDSDEAGINAARRSIAVFDNAFVNAQILVLQQGHDPDSYIQSYGIEAFTEAAAKASGAVEFLLESAIRNHGLSIDGKLRIVTELLQPLAAVQDAVVRSLHTRAIADRLDIKEDAIVEKLERMLKQPGSANRPANKIKPETNSSTAADADIYRIERQLIAMMLQFPDMITEIEKQQVLDHFDSQELRAIGVETIRCYKKCANETSGAGERGERWISEVIDRIDDHLKSLVARLADSNDSWSREGCQMLIAQFMTQREKKQSANTLEHRIKEAEAKKDDRLLQQLLIEKQKLAVQRARQKTAMLENN